MKAAVLLCLELTLTLVAPNETKNSDTNSKNYAKSRAEVQNVVGTCMKGFKSAIPSKFCFKQGADFGVGPHCGYGTQQDGLLCHDPCKRGYSYELWSCLERCRKYYNGVGPVCIRHIFDFYGRCSYGLKQYTLFHWKAVCKKGYYKFGALCYRDCANVGMENCGIGACALTKKDCGFTIATMIFDTLVGAIQAVAFVVSFATSSAAAGPLATLTKKFSKAALKQTFNGVKNYFMKRGKEQLKRRVVKLAKNIGNKLQKRHMNVMISTACATFADQTMDKMGASAPGFNFASYDITGISGIISSCQNIDSANAGVGCGKAVLSSISTVDPTGLTSIAAGLMHDVCDVPTYKAI